jgi:MFS family permease
MTRCILPRFTLPHRGWRVAAGAFLVLLAGWGAINSYAAFACDLGRAFDASPASVSLIYALSGGSCFLVGALAGPLADLIGPRRPAATGMLLAGFGLGLAGQATSLPGLCLTYGLLVGTGVGLAYVPALAAVQCWFVARRGWASGLAAMGIGIGTLLVPPVTRSLEALGDWRAELLALGTLVTAVGLAGALLLDGRPEKHELQPDGLRQPEATRPRAPAVLEGLPLAAVRRSRAFALLYFGTLLVSIPAAMPFAHLVFFAQKSGMAHQDAVALIALIGVGSIVGRVLLGAAADRIGRHTAFLGCCVGLSLATLVWPLARPALLTGFALAFGVFQGGFVALSSSVVVDLFGRRAAAGAIGLLHTGRGIALLFGPPAVAFAAAALDGYAIPLVVTALLGLLGSALAFCVVEKISERRSSSEQVLRRDHYRAGLVGASKG